MLSLKALPKWELEISVHNLGNKAGTSRFIGLMGGNVSATRDQKAEPAPRTSAVFNSLYPCEWVSSVNKSNADKKLIKLMESQQRHGKFRLSAFSIT